MKRKISSVLWAALSLTLLLFFAVGCGGTKGEIILSEERLSLNVYDDYLLTYELKDLEGTVEWSSSDAGIVSVDGGALSAKKQGVATVTAKIGEVNATCEVTVSPNQFVPALTVGETDSINLLVNGKFTLSPKVTFQGVEKEADFFYESDDETIATVSSAGEITAVADGEAIITVKSNYKWTELLETVAVTVKSSVTGVLTVGGQPVSALSLDTTDEVTVNVSTLLNGSEDESVEATWSKADDTDKITISQTGKDVRITGEKPGDAVVKLVLTKGEVSNEVELSVSVSKKAIRKDTELLIDKGSAAEGMCSVVLPDGIDVAAVIAVSDGENETEIASSDAGTNAVTFNVAEFASGEIALAFETERFRYSFDNVILADKIIKTKEDLTAFGAEMIAKTTGDKYYMLGADIDYGNGQWAAGWPTDAGRGATFAGTFNGRGHKISNINTRYGLFTTTINQSVVKNLFVSFPIVGSATGATICQTNNGTIENCMVETSVTKGEANVQFAGLAHKNNATGTIRNCVVKITSYTAYDTAKQINAIAHVNEGTISDCLAMSVCSDYLYGEIGEGLYVSADAFLAAVTSLPEENGWNQEYWSIESGLFFNNGKVIG